MHIVKNFKKCICKIFLCPILLWQKEKHTKQNGDSEKKIIKVLIRF